MFEGGCGAMKQNIEHIFHMYRSSKKFLKHSVTLPLLTQGQL